MGYSNWKESEEEKVMNKMVTVSQGMYRKYIRSHPRLKEVQIEKSNQSILQHINTKKQVMAQAVYDRLYVRYELAEKIIFPERYRKKPRRKK